MKSLLFCCLFGTFLATAPVSVSFISRTCGTSDTCSLNYVETSPHNEVTVRSRRTCCTGEECKTLPPPVLPLQVNQPNNLQCPGCIGFASKECTEHLVSCRGTENQCLSIIGKEFGSCHSCGICHNVGKDCEGHVEECTSPEDQCGTVLLEISPVLAFSPEKVVWLDWLYEI
ncbi:hypothetical protein L345_13086 [Ophiophagus hannah]|uniref:Phospholipase A2 inhibitor N-terminal domain-containing protein n=1 Tax=Ophiophagus hannah TaxID=8665 RepID=V8NGT4_OPHHA|nr:hypothetical protein L345_13086 [Ophiophagus hannah]